MRKLSLPDRDKRKPVLDDRDIAIIKETGIKTVKQQAKEIVEDKLKHQPENDGTQTPTRGNPVYKAMHACSVHSRKSLSRKYRIPAGRELTEVQVDSIVNLLTRWIAREYNFYKEEEKIVQGNLNSYTIKQSGESDL